MSAATNSALVRDPLTVTGLVADTITFSSVDGPGNRFVVFLQGCNFDCVVCHNPQTIHQFTHQSAPPSMRRTVADLVAHIRRAAPFVRGVTVSGGEATMQPEFLEALFTTLKADDTLSRLTCLVDSNGAAPPEVWDRLVPVMDGAMIDLKCLDDEIHRSMTGQSNAEVLVSIERLHRLGLLHEVRLLLLAGVNDDLSLIRRTAQWLAGIDPTMRLKVIGFRAHGARRHDPPLVEPTPDSLRAAAGVLADTAPFEITVV